MLIGALGTPFRARVDEQTRVRLAGAAWSCGWWIGADDRWRLPEREPAVRTAALDAAPVSVTHIRVPNGDAVARTYAVAAGVDDADGGGVVVCELENQSPAPCVAAVVVAGARSIAVDGRVVEIDGAPALLMPAAPPRWFIDRAPLDPEHIGADTGPVPRVADRGGALHAAFLFPLSHRNRLRVALGGVRPVLDLASLPDAQAAADGWRAQLTRGMTTALPEDAGQRAVDLARAQILLDPDPDAAAFAALEDWGFDAEAARAWRGLSLRDRRAARKRSADLLATGSPAAALLRIRAELLAETPGCLDLLPAPRAEWQGAPIEVHDAPTRLGALSFAVRWHGARPALLWELAGGSGTVVLRCPGLDPSWRTEERNGEALLAPVSAR